VSRSSLGAARRRPPVPGGPVGPRRFARRLCSRRARGEL